MKNLVLILLLSCSGRNVEIKSEKNFSDLKGWTVNIEKNFTDTLKTTTWFPDPEIKMEFSYRTDSSCLSPTFDFYPVELGNYIEKRLMRYLLLRAALFPPMPNIYSSDQYYVIGWNLSDYENLTCCECLELENELISRYNLKVKETR